MQAGNTSLKMRNMGQTILDTLLEKKVSKDCIPKISLKIFFSMIYNWKEKLHSVALVLKGKVTIDQVILQFLSFHL